MRFTYFLGISAILFGCGDSGDAPLAPPPDSSWLDFGVDAAPETTTCSPPDAALGDGVVTTDLGPVKGAQNAGVWSFKNIPYAAPPVGDLRWRPPQPAQCWSDVRDATQWGPMCPQSDVNGTAPVQGNEDCLQLNVWTKTPSSAASKPVMIWIHGGGFLLGSAVETAADGTRIYDAESFVAREDVVVVTINYRLGALGFLAHSFLDAENDTHDSGNYGMLDQLAALQWVKRNAASFGGDPTRITLFGESAGGASVCALLASPLSKGLVSGAIVESGGCVAHTIADAEAYGAQVVQGATCDKAGNVGACMRALTAEQVVDAFPTPVTVAGAGSPYGPVIDGTFLTGAPIDVVEAGGHQQVPIVLGNDAMETSRTVPLKQDATDADYQAAVAALFPTLKNQVIAHYPSSAYASPWAAYVALTTDAKFVCPTRRAARAFLDGQDLPVYRYWFTHALDDAPTLKPFGAWHGVDVLYVFGHLNVAGYVPSDAETTLSQTLQDDWARLAAGNPPSDAWPAYDPTDPYEIFDAPISTGTALHSTQCDFWDSVTE